MNKARLVLIEGLPGSGKTTAMRMVSDLLVGHGIGAEAWYEDSLDHPADFDGTAFLEADAFHALKGKTPGIEALQPVTTPFMGGYLVAYRKALEAHRLSPDTRLLETLARNDVYELQPDLHVRLIQARWKNFVRDHQDERKVFLFECSFLQNPVTALMVRHDAPEEMTTAHVQEMMRIISPLDPVLLYMEQKDLRKSFLQAVRDRPLAWYEGFERYYTDQGYGRTHGHHGMEGVLRILEVRARLEKDILRTLSIPCHLVDNASFHPSTLRDTLTDILTARLILPGGTMTENEKGR